MRLMLLLLLASCSARNDGLGAREPLPVPAPMRVGGVRAEEGSDRSAPPPPPTTTTTTTKTDTLPVTPDPPDATPGDPDAGSVLDAAATDLEPRMQDAGPRSPDTRPMIDVRLPPATRFAGTLARSNTSKFGGPPYCYYFVTMLDVTSTIVFDDAGTVTAAEVASTMDETVDSCPHAPVGRRRSTFSLLGGSIKGSVVTIHYRGSAANSPTASLTFVGTRTGTAVSGTFTWHRTDQGTSNLAWTVTGAINHAAVY